MQRAETLGYILTIATVLCVVCSFAVSIAAVALRPYQDENKVMDRKRNILNAAGLAEGEFGVSADKLSASEVEKQYSEWISEKLINLDTGEYDSSQKIDKYDPRAAAKIDSESSPTEGGDNDIGIARREKIARVYFVRRPGTDRVQQIVLPVYGKGLWSTMYGFVALKNDIETIQGLTFYEHGETPGLGGEVDNPLWKAQWVGQKLYNPEGVPAAEVFKGPAPDGNPYAVDGLSGATITSRGVTNLLRYWAGDAGYGKFLKKFKSELAASFTSSAKESTSSGATP